jgi:hypothetical protein
MYEAVGVCGRNEGEGGGKERDEQCVGLHYGGLRGGGRREEGARKFEKPTRQECGALFGSK